MSAAARPLSFCRQLQKRSQRSSAGCWPFLEIVIGPRPGGPGGGADRPSVPNAKALSGRRRAGHSSLLFGGPVMKPYAPKMTRVPVEGITSFCGIVRCTAMIVLNPVQCDGMM